MNSQTIDLFRAPGRDSQVADDVEDGGEGVRAVADVEAAGENRGEGEEKETSARSSCERERYMDIGWSWVLVVLAV